jgi:hypothetical protein
MRHTILLLVLSSSLFAQYVNATGGGGDSVDTVATAPVNHTSGNLLYAIAKHRDACDATTMTLTDPQGNTYIQIGSLVDNASLTCTGHFYAKNIIGNANNVVTLTLEGSHRLPSLKVIQLAGRDIVNPLTTFKSGTTTASATATSSVFTTTVADTIVVAGFVPYGSDTLVSGMIGGSAATVSSGSDGYSNTVWGEYRELSATQSDITASGTSAGGTINTIVVAAFAASGGSPPPTAARRRVIN